MDKKNCLLVLFLCASVIIFCKCTGESQKKKKGAWSVADSIVGSLAAPTFPTKKFPITDFGAVSNSEKDCSEPIRLAIIACSKAGGGEVIIPEGNYCTGPIHLKSNVNLHLNKGAVLKFSADPAKYLPLVLTRWEGVELMNYSPLVYAFGQDHIAITGEGILDGCASPANWWAWKGLANFGWRPGMPNQKDATNRPALFAMAEKDVPVQQRRFGEHHYLRPQFIQPYRCTNVLIQGITIINSPMWVIHPVLCTNVIVDKVRVESDGPNTDGCDPESCKNVLIKNCYFNTGDDCIALKSGRNRDGRRIGVACENVVIQHCTMANGHGGIVIGSEISGGVKNVYAENCRMSSPHLDRAFRLKSSSARGGTTENIYLRNIKVDQVKEQAIMATMFYEDSGAYKPIFRNIEICNMQVDQGGNCGIVIEGYKESPVQNFRLYHIQIKNAKYPSYISNANGVKFEKVSVNNKKIKVSSTIGYNVPSTGIVR